MKRVPKIASFVSAVAVVGMLCGCSNARKTGAPVSADQNISSAKAAIQSAGSEMEKAIAAKDVAACVSFYRDSAVMFVPNAPAFVGKDAISAAWKQLLAAPSVMLTFPTMKIDVARSGDLAVERGSFRAVTKDSKGKTSTENGELVMVWQKQSDGSWKILADTNADLK